ncbi:hypothetical protein [Comamonas thiooxydans]|uniref:hypothetical protein n=1 Tax=Comamonas thiooxydans TaxID=363952 RepID=UPI000B41AE85|nr:hypothetical protein [Comamonas thiooxydans]
MTIESRQVAPESRHITSTIASPELATELSTWLSDQKARGLVALHLGIDAKPGVSAQAIAKELLAAEKAIAAGQFREPPRPAP